MALGVSYESVIDAAGDLYTENRGVKWEGKILERLGLSHEYLNGCPVGDFVCMSRGILSPQFFRSFSYGRRALMSVPSLNIPDAMHMVYWNGREIMDPSQGERYGFFHDLKPEDIVLFREAWG